jgi:GTP-binding protein EngB required for normal cell division
MPSLELKKFDMRRIQFQANDASDKSKGPTIVLIGRRDTGKSMLIKDIMYHHRTIPMGAVISGTEVSNQFFSKLVPKIFIHNEYNTAIIENLVK